jgi:hypothetical protein
MSNLNPITSTAAAIAAQLGETERAPRATIWRIVRTIGPERTQAFVAQAQEIEANGGMLVPDGSRKRTLGGIFFYLVRTQVSDDEAMQINRAWRWQQWKQRQPAKSKSTAAPAPPPLPPFVWDEADPIIAELTATIGEASTVVFSYLGSFAAYLHCSPAPPHLVPQSMRLNKHLVLRISTSKVAVCG